MPGGPLSDPAAAQALAMIGLPSRFFRGVGDSLPGLGAPAPGGGFRRRRVRRCRPAGPRCGGRCRRRGRLRAVQKG